MGHRELRSGSNVSVHLTRGTCRDRDGINITSVPEDFAREIRSLRSRGTVVSSEFHPRWFHRRPRREIECSSILSVSQFWNLPGVHLFCQKALWEGPGKPSGDDTAAISDERVECSMPPQKKQKQVDEIFHQKDQTARRTRERRLRAT